MNRIEERLAALKEEGKKAFITYTTAGLPFYIDSAGRNCGFPGGYVCFHGDSRIQYQPADPVCASARYRYGGG